MKRQILFYSLLAYLPFLFLLGFYSDDLFFGYVGRFFGPKGIIDSLKIDRPLIGYLFAYLFQLLGDNPLNWHLYSLMIRLTGGYLFYQSLLKIWPNYKTLTFVAVLTFLIYPGFLQQPLSLGYAPWHTNLTLWFFSLLFTVLSLKSSKKYLSAFYLILAIISQTFTLLFIEFFVGLEILRFALIVYVLNKRANKQILIYLSSITVFLIWRIFIFKSTRDVTDLNWVSINFYQNPDWWLWLPIEFVVSVLHTTIFAYFLPIAVNLLRIPVFASLAIFCLGLIISRFFYINIKKINFVIPKLIAKKILLIGIITLVGSLFPVILSGRIVRLHSAYDRYTYTAMVGVSLVLVGTLFLNVKHNIKRHLIFTAIIYLSITSHLLNGFYRFKEWKTEKDIWWQLSWRGSEIVDNSFVLLYFPPLIKNNMQNKIINHVKWYQTYWVDYQIWTTLNFFQNYNKPFTKHLRGGLLSDVNTTKKLVEKQVEMVTDRGLVYQNNYQNSIIISTPNDKSCLWVLDSMRQEVPMGNNLLIEKYLSYSNVTLLDTNQKPSTPPKAIFGKEPKQTWCYYFQKASLLRQQENWDELLKITTYVMGSSYRPNDPNEWLPFLEGLIINNKLTEAEALIKTITTGSNPDTNFPSNCCKMLDRLKTNKIKC